MVLTTEHRVGGGSHHVKSLGKGGGELIAAVRQFDGAGQPFEQPYTEPFFECLYLMAYGRLGDTQFVRSPGKTHVAGGTFEHTQSDQWGKTSTHLLS